MLFHERVDLIGVGVEQIDIPRPHREDERVQAGPPGGGKIAFGNERRHREAAIDDLVKVADRLAAVGMSSPRIEGIEVLREDKRL